MACVKKKYRDKLGAEFALAEIRRKDRPGRAKFQARAYRCNECHRWHLTSREK